ncbi:MAG: exo-alpha-sialidase [Thermoplasmata archaeon]
MFGHREWREPTFIIALLLITVIGIIPTAEAHRSTLHPSAQPPVGEVADAPSPFYPNVRVTDGRSAFPHQVEPFIVVDGERRLFVGWKEAETADGPGARVGFSRSLDGGLTWSTNALMELLDTSPGRRQSDPWLVVDERGRLYYARLEYTADLVGNGVTVSRSDDGGETWGPIVDVDDRRDFADKESMANDGNGTVYVAYDDVDSQDEKADIRITHSTDGGGTWRNTTAVADQRGDIASPVMATRPNGTVYAAWWDWGKGNIMASVSWDRGVTWSTDVRVNPIPGSASWDENQAWQLSLPSLVIDATGTLFVAWADRGNGDLDIVVARSHDGGATWSLPVRLNDDASRREQRMVALAVDGNDLLLAVWLDNRTGQLNVYYANSSDSGRSWSPNLRVTEAETPSSYVRPGDYLGLAVDRNGTVYVVWTDGRGEDLDIYFAQADLTKPTIDILSPSRGEILASTSVRVSGIASDNVAVERVEISINGMEWVLAEGTSSWEAVLILPGGDNTIYARAMDTSANIQTVSISVRIETGPPLYLLVLPIGAVVAASSVLLVWRWRVRRRRGETG